MTIFTFSHHIQYSCTSEDVRERVNQPTYHPTRLLVLTNTKMLITTCCTYIGLCSYVSENLLTPSRSVNKTAFFSTFAFTNIIFVDEESVKSVTRPSKRRVTMPIKMVCFIS